MMICMKAFLWSFFLATPVVTGQQAVPLTSSFDVASVRQCSDDVNSPPIKSSPGRLSLVCWPLRRLIQDAYETYASGAVDRLNPGYPLTPIVGDPEWIDRTKYSISAVSADKPSVALMRGPMMQRLLEDRFRLRIHREQREIKAYIMTVAKTGSKLKATNEGSCNHLDPTDPTQDLKVMPGGKPWCVMTPPTVNNFHFIWDVRGMSIGIFSRLMKIEGVPVIDQTGLTGTYDIHLEYDIAAPRSAELGIATDPQGTPVISAIRKQLGLQLDLGNGSREVLVIEHLERPAGN